MTLIAIAFVSEEGLRRFRFVSPHGAEAGDSDSQQEWSVFLERARERERDTSGHSVSINPDTLSTYLRPLNTDKPRSARRYCTCSKANQQRQRTRTRNKQNQIQSIMKTATNMNKSLAGMTLLVLVAFAACSVQTAQASPARRQLMHQMVWS
jgi:hypothetical protein